MLRRHRTSPVPDTYFSVQSLKLAVPPEHKMLPLVEQNFNSEELQTVETHNAGVVGNLAFSICRIRNVTVKTMSYKS